MHAVDLHRGDWRVTPRAPDAEFSTFYEAEYTGVVALAYGLTGSAWAAEELAQEAFIVVHGRWDEVAELDSPAAWVRRVAMNKAVSVLRRRSAEARAVLRLAGQRTLAQPMDERDEAFWREVRALPARQAQTLALYYVEDRPTSEIADILGISAATVKVHMHRGRQTLATRLGCAYDDTLEGNETHGR